MRNNTLQVQQKVLHTIKAYKLFEEGESVLVAVSGGADSVCLLHSLFVLKEELKLSLSVAHVNHCIRGKEADADEKVVCNLCKKLHIPCYTRAIQVPKLAEEEGVSIETAGRLARYRFFSEICKKNKISKIATAHNRNDQAETVLMRIMRGTGLQGLGGIRYKREDGVVRPLLDVERAEIEAYCEENNLSYCTDSTNLETVYTRNKIRNELLPLIQDGFNPNIVETLGNMAKNMDEDATFIHGYAHRLYQRLNSPAPAKKPYVLDIESMQYLDIAMQNRMILMATQDAMGKDYHLERKHLDMVRGLLQGETGAGVNLPGGLFVSVQYGWLSFTDEIDQSIEDSDTSIPVCKNLVLEKEYDMNEWKLSFSVAEPPFSIQKNQMLFDYDLVCDLSLELRCRAKGDRIAVFKDGRCKRLKSFMIDQKIPRAKRNTIPLLCAEDQVLAVIGYRVAEPYKVNENTKRGLILTYDAGNEDW